MSKVRFRKILDEDRLADFHKKFCLGIKYEVPINYLRSGNCYGLFVDDKIVAGICSVHQHALYPRSLKQIPCFSYISYKKDFILSLAEITGYFIEDKAYAFRFTMHLFRIFLFHPAKNFVYSYPVDQKRLSKYYAKGKPITIYSGKPVKIEGHPDDLPPENVEILTKWGIFRIFLHRTLKYLRLSNVNWTAHKSR